MKQTEQLNNQCMTRLRNDHLKQMTQTQTYPLHNLNAHLDP